MGANILHELLGDCSSQGVGQEAAAPTAPSRVAYEEPEGMGLWFGEVGSTMVAGYPSGPTGAASVIVAVYPTGLDAQDSSQHDDAERVVVRIRTRPRARTFSGPIKRAERATDDELRELDATPRPVYRSDCVGSGINAQRPCPWVSCKHHLYTEVIQLSGSVRLPFGECDLEELPYTCSLDVASLGGAALEEVGGFMNLTKQSVRNIEMRALPLVKERGISPSMLDPKMADWLDNVGQR